MATERLTADTITDDQIRELRREASAAGDMEQALACDVALGRLVYDPMDQRAQLLDQVGAVDVASAREVCAEAINAARASE